MTADVVIAVDVGGTTIKAARLGRDPSPRHSHRYPTGAEQGPDAVRETILHVVTGLVDAARADGVNPRAVGVAVPGVVDEAAGVATWSSNLGLRETPLRDLVAARTGLPVAVGNDARAGALAEARFGAAQQVRHALFVAVGAGVSAAHLVDGRPAAGAHGGAGALGHVPVRPNGPPCSCGARGCLETVASAASVMRRYAELSLPVPAASPVPAAPFLAGLTPPRPALPTPGPEPGAGAEQPPIAERADAVGVAAERAGVAGVAAERADAAGVTAAEITDTAGVAAAALAGDRRAARAWQDTVDALADGLALAQALYDVEAIVLGGGLAAAGDTLLTPLRIAVKERLTFHRAPRLVTAHLGDLASCVGAGLLAWDQAEDRTEDQAEDRAEDRAEDQAGDRAEDQAG